MCCWIPVFFIRLLNDEDPLHKNAVGYYKKHYLETGVDCQISTISVAEYCVRGTINELPLRNLKILPFNITHAVRAGEFADIIFREKKLSGIELNPRPIIPNDSKLFAQADIEESISHFVTSDTRSLRTFAMLSNNIRPRFTVQDISVPYNEAFGLLEL